MPETTHKHWYQDGFVVFMAVGGVALLLFMVFNPKQKFVELETSAFRDGNTLVISCWHIFPGTLEKGRLSVMLEGDAIPNGQREEHHSFDAWKPNQENLVMLRFPLDPATVDQPILVRYSIISNNARDTLYKSEWTGDKWSRPLTDVSVR